MYTPRRYIINDSKLFQQRIGDVKGRWSIRINNQWRICFVPINGGVDYSEVEIVDYH